MVIPISSQCLSRFMRFLIIILFWARYSVWPNLTSPLEGMDSWLFGCLTFSPI